MGTCGENKDKSKKRSVVKNEVKNEINNAVKKEIKNEIKSEVKKELKNEAKIGIKINLNEGIKSEVFTGHKPVPVKIINKVMKSICKITIETKKGKSYGTGFFLNYSNSNYGKYT